MINPSAKFTISSYPYNYLVVEDLFDKGTAYGLSSVFNDLIQTGRTIGKVGEVGELVYDAINFTPKLEHIQSTPISNIASTELKNLIAEVFDIYLDENLMIGMHRHLPPSKPGWTHTDLAVVSFPNIPVNHGGLRVYSDADHVNYSDDSKNRQPNTVTISKGHCTFSLRRVAWSEVLCVAI
jgi:hypothetical protein